MRDAATKVVETLAGERCPCGHLKQRHRQPTGDIAGETLGACRDCACAGLIDASNPAQCGECDGTGECPECDDGYYPTGEQCDACAGSGDCVDCEGTGDEREAGNRA